MNFFQVAADTERLANDLILPVFKGESYEAALHFAAQKTGTNIEWLKGQFGAETKEILPLCRANSNAGSLFLLGMGEKTEYPAVSKISRTFYHKTAKKLSTSLGIWLDHLQSSTHLPTIVEAMTNGFMLGTYQTSSLKTDPDPPYTHTDIALYLSAPSAVIDAATAEGISTAHTQLKVFDLVNNPPSLKTPQHLAEWAIHSGKTYGYSVKVLDKNQIEEEGLHALLAVNRGSTNPPTFIVMEYRPDTAHPLPTIGLVGKGVTFDTGGISIKASSNMHYMKSDMGGAAAVLGTLELVARLALPVHLIGIVPSTENLVDANSLLPSEVIKSHSGKTIEIIDTDAEGRLILADGLSYIIQHYHPDTIIDIATLTGSTVRTFGYHTAALFTNNDELASQLYTNGQQTGERLWRLPLWDDYLDDIKSDIADLRNFSGKPSAGAISAAKFLEAFTNNHPRWAHLDIAGVAFADSEYGSQKIATAYGVRLLTQFCKNYLTHQHP